ncbi:acetyl-CoA C-acetyltransferase [Phaeovibrio sulfidiphilus]|uniref:Acetyl-CoA C-acetyltransferase n=1 Tax=Phaeovibrio sulfidiphilus TaxID=1220600 RepID=A0A8J6YQH8_9PROT|nr:acetyl-CoA C-acetyltransferase [Phaeovibrio sulfidiphilus]MBE1237856.1 acetyl-CoA C-acetyltransferase [Phaeovibrio sulfidiphilus]
MTDTVIVSAARTPFGKFGGGLASLSATDLGGVAIRETVRRSGLAPDAVDRVIMGHVVQAGCGQITARQAARSAGLPWETLALTVNRVCCSGLSAVALAHDRLQAGHDEIIVAGGMESMSRIPYALPTMRFGARMTDTGCEDLMLRDGLWCPFDDRHMAVHGSEAAREFGISREAQDAWALRSHQRAVAAAGKGVFDGEIVPVTVASRKGETLVARDEGPRADTSPEALAKLPPLFVEDGTVTAGNAPGVNDGAASLMVMRRSRAERLGLRPLATVEAHAEAAEEARWIATVPGRAALRALERAGLSMNRMDLIEVNEAFAAVVLVSGVIAGWDHDRVNVNGGAIAFGHPVGASGARILLHLIRALEARGGGYGLACLCSGAAQGDAMIVRVDP